ncbi:RNA 2'-phosphotransferase [Blastococcus brunescens]|uniref:Probable RNA 2'-phosphotransferase n=1 Tax=Blastococcus brunescens TaxID=1564165 RepID=A0ABZ1AZJ5_9ACTN|nr:RNA 2'-phosphotransferase [Blastococcus sp. BMG 8361]WRL63986.1 RNA 2'-phosphotransferase [Blastococcus sp. BMG 8361]
MSAPDNEIPVAVPLNTVLARTSDVAVALTGLQVYSTGVSFDLAFRVRSPLEPAHRGLSDLVFEHGASSGRFLLGIEMADGRRASNVFGRDSDDGIVFHAGGGGGGELSVDQSWWLHPFRLRVRCASCSAAPPGHRRDQHRPRRRGDPAGGRGRRDALALEPARPRPTAAPCSGSADGQLVRRRLTEALVDVVRVSKRLSFVLRHQPASVGIALDAAGWVGVDDLLRALAAHGLPLTREDLDAVVAGNDKRRFALDESGTRIRASQGHSVPVDLGYAPATPPAELFHGTVERFLPAILAEGLWPGRRHAVHLSADVATARTVGGRRGRAVVLRVEAARLAADGTRFSVSANGVWLVDVVPPEYLSVTERGQR